MAAPINKKDLPRDKCVCKQKKEACADLIQGAYCSQGIGFSSFFQIVSAPPRGREDQTRCQGIDPDLGGQFLTEHTGQGKKNPFADMVGKIPAVIVHNPCIEKVDNTFTLSRMPRKGPGQEKRPQGI